MKIFMILLITLLTVSAWTGTTQLNINCTDQRPCGLSSKCIQGRCFPMPGPLIGDYGPVVGVGADGPPDGQVCDHRCVAPYYECRKGKCHFLKI